MLETGWCTATRKVGDWFAVFVGPFNDGGLVACEVCAKNWVEVLVDYWVQVGGGVCVLLCWWGMAVCTGQHSAR